MPKPKKSAAKGHTSIAVMEPEPQEVQEQEQDTATENGQAPAEKKPRVKLKAWVEPDEKKIIYPDVKATLKIGDKALKRTDAEKILRWEKELEFRARIKHNYEGIAPEAITFSAAGLTPQFVDLCSAKVMCWANRGNRPFDKELALAYAQDILTRQWACPMNFPGETLNGETIVIGRSGAVLSGQHRLIGFLFACQLWAQQEKYKHYWKSEPVFECLIVTGVSENRKIVQTIDNVRPRSDADIIYTSPLFAKTKDENGKTIDTDPSDKKEMSKMLATATDLLWKRTQAGEVHGSHVYRTRSQLQTFRDNHKTLLDCVKHLWEENKGKGAKARGISLKNLSPGNCAALCYLMAASQSDGDAYRNADPPSEKKCDLDMLEKANEFFTLLSGAGKLDPDNPSKVREGNKTMFPVVDALAMLVDIDGGATGRQTEKHAVIVKAWLQFSSGQPIAEEDLELEIGKDADGKPALFERPIVGGIDLGEGKKAKAKADIPTEGEVSKTIEQQTSDRLREAAAKQAEDKLAEAAKEPHRSLKQEAADVAEKQRKRLADRQRLMKMAEAKNSNSHHEPE